MLEREPPLPVYIGMCVHSMSRNKTLIKQLHTMGLSISYDRAIQLEDQLAVSACERFKDDDVVIPACLRKGLFTVGALDNLDQNPTFITSSDSFHGIGISLFQIPKQSQTGERRPSLIIPPSGNKQDLPDVLETTGKEQYNHFAKSVFEERVIQFMDRLRKTHFHCSRKKHRVTSQQRKKVEILKNNVALFGQLYIATQSRDGDLDEFFAHEIQSFPPSLSDFGKLHLPSKKSRMF